MAVSFNTIPQKIMTPLFYAEVDNSAANTTTDSMQALLIGPMLTTGTATASGRSQRRPQPTCGTRRHRSRQQHRPIDNTAPLTTPPH